MRIRAGCFHRSAKRADCQVRQVADKLKCSTLRVFILAFVDGTRDAARKAYHRFLKHGSLVAEVREFVYKALHNLLPEKLLKAT